MRARLVSLGFLLLPVASFVFACSDDGAAPESPTSTATPSPDAGAETGTPGSPSADAAPTPIAVHGKLLDPIDAPLAGYKVLVPGTTDIVTTAADGTFSFTASVPYDVVAVSPTGDNIVDVIDLTRPDPIIPLPVSASPYVSGTFQGAMPAIDDKQSAQVIFAPTNGTSTSADYQLIDGPTETYSHTVQWQAPADVVGTLHVFEYAPGVASAAGSFLGYASVADRSCASSATTTVDFPALTSLTTSKISGSMTVPDGWTKGGSFFTFMRLDGTTSRLAVNQSLSAELAFDVPMPVFPNAVYGISFRASGTKNGEQSVVRKTVALAATATVAMPSAAVLATPDADATGLDATTVFRWSKGEGISYLGVFPAKERPSASAPAIHFVTTGTTVRMPGAAALAAALPAAKKYRWSVITYPPIATTDALASGGNFDWYCTPGSPIGKDEATCTFSEVRAFTTK
jgi:hypothetical protein